MKEKLVRLLVVCLVLGLSFSACADEAQESVNPVSETVTEMPTPVPTESPAPEPTAVPDPTDVPEAISEPEPSQTPAPSETPTPSEPPVPEDTPAAAATSVPTDMPVETPVSSDAPVPAQTPDVMPDATEIPARRIIAMEAVPSEATMQEKPALDVVLVMLPSTVSVTLADGTAAEVTMVWNCGDFETEAAEYVFASALSEQGYILAEDVEMPVFILRIEPETEKTFGDYLCRMTDDGYAIIACSGSGSSVVVPAAFEGVEVTEISTSAFAGNDSVRELVLPDSVRRIGDGAFSGCSRLEKATLTDSLETIGSGIFSGCGSLEHIELKIGTDVHMSDAFGYTRKVFDENGSERTVNVRLERAITDIEVRGSGVWRVDGEFRIEKECAASVNGRLVVSESGSVIVMGELDVAGSLDVHGRIVACAGTVHGAGEGVVTEHEWAKHVCTLCGAEMERVIIDVVPTQDCFEKVYDGNSGFALGAEDFLLEGILPGDDVSLAAVNLDFEEKDAGEYTALMQPVFAGEDAGWYTVGPAEIRLRILPKPVTVTPKQGQGKIYGAEDPSLRAGYTGTVEGETLRGSLSRKKGEEVGSYRILPGTLIENNPNYEIAIEEAYFKIEPKSFKLASIAVKRIPNQSYTGGECTPDVEVRDGERILAEGADYTVSYSGNVGPGDAKATIAGTGNYTGSRTVSFRIIKTSGGSAGSGDFGAAGDKSDEKETPDKTPAVETLVLGETDLGPVLFDSEAAVRSFVQSERSINEGERNVLCIAAEVDAEKEEYGALCMKFSMECISAVRAAGYTDVEFRVGETGILIPMDTLYAEYVNEAGTMRINRYEICLQPLGADALNEAETAAMEGFVPCTEPVRLELLAVSGAEMEEAKEDVLGLLMGVQLLMTPEEEPDYENTEYFAVFAPVDENSDVCPPEAARFVMDEFRVKCVIEPTQGGMYALAEKE